MGSGFRVLGLGGFPSLDGGNHAPPCILETTGMTIYWGFLATLSSARFPSSTVGFGFGIEGLRCQIWGFRFRV